MKLSISNIGWEEKNDIEVYNLMKKYGFSGVEIAPTRWVPGQPYDHVDEAVSIAERLKLQYGFEVPSMQSIWFGKQEKVFASEEERSELVSYTKKAIDYAAAIGCKNLVFGCPRNRNVAEEWNLTEQQVDEIAEKFFGELGAYAESKGVVLAMEANPPIYNTNYVNTTEQAIALVKSVASSGFLVNLDFGTMIANTEDVALLEENIPVIHHIHISEPGLKSIEKREAHKKLAKLLRVKKYEGYVSIEVGKQEDIKSLEEMMKYVAEVFHD